jgi:hypothetical protein
MQNPKPGMPPTTVEEALAAVDSVTHSPLWNLVGSRTHLRAPLDTDSSRVTGPSVFFGLSVHQPRRDGARVRMPMSQRPRAGLVVRLVARVRRR